MKQIIVTVGLIILGIIIAGMILGDGDTLQSATGDYMQGLLNSMSD